MKSFFSRSNTFLFISLLVLAFVIRLFFLLYFKFDGLYGQDAYAYLDCSQKFYNSVIAFKVPPNFYWPIGFYLFSAIFSFITNGNVTFAALLVSLNAGALTAGIMFLLGNEILKTKFNPVKAKKYSFIGGLIIIFAGITIKSSAVIMSDSLAMMFITAAAYFLVLYYYKQKRLHIILSFAAVAFGTMTRYADGIFVPAMFLLLFPLLKESRTKNKILVDLIWGITAGIIIFLPQLIYIYKYGFSYFHYWGNTTGMYASWSPLNMFKKDFTTVDGTQNYRFYNILFFITPVFYPLFLSLFGIPFIYGLIRSFKNLPKILYVFLFGWIAVYVLYLSGNTFQAIRFTLSFYPALIIFAVYGIAEINLKVFIKNIFVFCGIILLAGYSFYDFSNFAERKQKEMANVEWIGNNINPASNLFTFEVTDAVKHYTGINAKEFFSFNYSAIKQISDTSAQNTYFFLPVERIHSQWKGLPIESCFDSLRSHTKLISIGKVNEFEAFKIEK